MSDSMRILAKDLAAAWTIIKNAELPTRLAARKSERLPEGLKGDAAKVLGAWEVVMKEECSAEARDTVMKGFDYTKASAVDMCGKVAKMEKSYNSLKKLREEKGDIYSLLLEALGDPGTDDGMDIDSNQEEPATAGDPDQVDAGQGVFSYRVDGTSTLTLTDGTMVTVQSSDAGSTSVTITNEGPGAIVSITANGRLKSVENGPV